MSLPLYHSLISWTIDTDLYYMRALIVIQNLWVSGQPKTTHMCNQQTPQQYHHPFAWKPTPCAATVPLTVLPQQAPLEAFRDQPAYTPFSLSF